MWEFPGDDDPYEESFIDHGTVEAITSVLHAQHVFTHRIWEMEGLWIKASSFAAPEGCEWFYPSQLEEIALPSAMASFKEYVKKHL
jgi:A/G-specific adenine glycosylase